MTDDLMQFGQLRGIQKHELDLMLAWRNAPTVRKNMYTRHEISREEHLAWWHRTKSRADQQYYMYEREGIALGVVAFTAIDSASENASWAFYASPDAPRGTGSRMEILALEHAFDKLGLHKLHCEVLAFNKPVISLHQKFGFKIEGILREQHKVDEEFTDIYRLGLLASEWEDLRQAMIEKLSTGH